MMLARAVLIGLLMATTTLCAQQSAEARKYANEFLNIGVGARALGMGNTQTALATGVTAGYWNPAGLAAREASLDPEVSLMHAAYFGNVAAYNYVGFAMPIDSAGRKRFGLSLVRIGVDDIANTLYFRMPDGSFNLDEIRSFSISDFAAIFSYGWRPKGESPFSFGVNGKVVYRGAGRFGNAWGFGLDAGLRYQRNNFTLGIMTKDITQTFTAWTYNTETFEEAFINAGQEIPQNRVEITRPSVRLGLAYELSLGKRFDLTPALDFDVFFDGERVAAFANFDNISLDPHLGLELAYTNDLGRKVAFLRGGIYNFQYLDLGSEETSVSDVFPTMGIGLRVNNFELDYALTNFQQLSAGSSAGFTTLGSDLLTHVVSLNVRIR
ncbi:MAG: hypothetical protein AB8F95_09795 [Bacteroidia bacterium]